MLLAANEERHLLITKENVVNVKHDMEWHDSRYEDMHRHKLLVFTDKT